MIGDIAGGVGTAIGASKAKIANVKDDLIGRLFGRETGDSAPRSLGAAKPRASANLDASTKTIGNRKFYTVNGSENIGVLTAADVANIRTAVGSAANVAKGPIRLDQAQLGHMLERHSAEFEGTDHTPTEAMSAVLQNYDQVRLSKTGRVVLVDRGAVYRKGRIAIAIIEPDPSGLGSFVYTGYTVEPRDLAKWPLLIQK